MYLHYFFSRRRRITTLEAKIFRRVEVVANVRVQIHSYLTIVIAERLKGTHEKLQSVF